MRRSPRRPALASVAVAAALTATLAACGGGAENETPDASGTPSASTSADDGGGTSGVSGEFPLEVSGDLGSEPEVEFDSPLDLDETVSEIVIEGEGEPVADGTPVLLDLWLANAETGETIGSSHESGTPVATTLSADAVFPAAYEALSGQPAGTRVAIVAQPEDGYGPEGQPQLNLEAGQDLVVVVDLLSAAPTEYPRLPQGERQDVPDLLPSIETENGAVTGLDFSDAAAEPPRGLQLYYLIRGDGPEIEAPSFAAFNYFGQVWGADEPFDQSFDADPLVQPIGLGQFIQGWDQGLVGVPAGSRVALVVPPAQGYGEQGQPSAGIGGDDTMLFIIDVLAVS
ncbi:FKBP-type peptidyl-prolyl cis-trans isomerase [Nocardioidaceae bacterium]|nr:FKBP-type peptidyl-prolyl cis-trans isomerase [Nocardioidaceae bacterium]